MLCFYSLFYNIALLPSVIVKYVLSVFLTFIGFLPKIILPNFMSSNVWLTIKVWKLKS